MSRAGRYNERRYSPLVAYETILYQVDDDHVATVTLNRPDKLNSFNMAMRQDFRQLWRDIQDDDAVHAVVLRAAGDRAAGQQIRALVQVERRHADRDRCLRAIQARDDIGQQGRISRAAAVHFPVTYDELGPHQNLSLK